MQTLIQVVYKGKTSLRERIVKDAQLDQFGLVVSELKQTGRNNGWAKIHMSGHHGAINVQWHAAARMLICRVVTRGGKSHAIVSAFVEFLLTRHSKQIVSIQIMPPF